MPEPFQTVTLDAQQGRVEAIWLKRAHRGPMDPVNEAVLDPNEGLVGTVDRSRRRQVTLLEREAWDAVMSDLGADLDPSSRRANVLVSGVRLANTRSQVLAIGSATLLIGGEVTPCERMEQVLRGLQMSMRPDWRGGVFAQVLTGGTIRVGDLVELKPTSKQPPLVSEAYPAESMAHDLPRPVDLGTDQFRAAIQRVIEIPELTTPRLLLRGFQQSDLDAYAEIMTDPEVTRYIGDGKSVSRADAWRQMATFCGHWVLRGFGIWVVEERATGALLGRIGFWQPEGWPGFELAYTLGRPYWGHGFATEGARAALTYGRETLGRKEIISLIRPANSASVRVAEALGAMNAGTIELLGEPAFLYQY